MRFWYQSLVGFEEGRLGEDVLGSVGGVVHEEEIDVADVVHEEGLVAGGGEVAGLPVATVTNLFIPSLALVHSDSQYPSSSSRDFVVVVVEAEYRGGLSLTLGIAA